MFRKLPKDIRGMREAEDEYDHLLVRWLRRLAFVTVGRVQRSRTIPEKQKASLIGNILRNLTGIGK